MTRRRRSYRSLASLQRDNRACRACADAGYPLESLPVFEGAGDRRALIVGQAPGFVEAGERRPWRGRAGRTLRAWLNLDEEAFYATFYCSSVTRCYPGKHPSGRGDRTPTPAELDLCAFWLDWELRLLRPALVLPVGGLAIRRLLGITRLADCVGSRFVLGEATAVPLPHPSGASGWLNDGENRARLERALALVRAELLAATRAPSRAGASGRAGTRTRRA
ncbi:MAG TPA: uracil-DNA glycosylase family protein [Gaiellaceae bacterium]|nr:uracil-DNA glycosylase family protein [Gaiellaceae bacterium]